MNRLPIVLLAVVVTVEAGGLALAPKGGGHERTPYCYGPTCHMLL